VANKPVVIRFTESGLDAVESALTGVNSKLETVDAATRNLGSAGDTAKAGMDRAAGAGRDAGASFDRAGQGLDTLDNKTMRAGSAFGGLSDALQGVNSESLTTAERFAYIGLGVSDMAAGVGEVLLPALKRVPGVMGAVTKAQAALNFVMNLNPVLLVVTAVAALSAAFVIAYKKSETFRNIVTGAFEKVTEGAAVFLRGLAGVVGIFNKGWAESIRGAADRVESFGQKADSAGETVVERFESASDKARKLRNRMQDLSDVTATFSGEARDLDSSMISLEAAIDDATKAAKDNGKQTDISTRKGRENRNSLIDLAGSHADLIESMKDNGASQKELQAKTRDTRKEFIEVAVKMGYTREEARKLADKYGLIPKNIRTNVSAPGLSTTAERAARLNNALAGISATVRQRERGGGGDGLGIGGIVNAADRWLDRFAIGTGTGGLMGVSPMSAVGQLYSSIGRPGDVISGVRPGARTLSGGYSYHGQIDPRTGTLGRALDFSPMRSVAQLLYSSFRGRIRELISPWPELGVLNGRPHRFSDAVQAQHDGRTNVRHVHLAAERGALLTRPTLLLAAESAKARAGGGEVVSPVAMMAATFERVLAKRGTPTVNVVSHVYLDGDEVFAKRVNVLIDEREDREDTRLRMGGGR